MALADVRCVCRKLDSAILMVKAAKDRSCDDGAEFRLCNEDGVRAAELQHHYRTRMVRRA